MRNSLIIMLFFAAGIVCGLLHLIPEGLVEGNASTIALCALMLCVGISLGYDSDVLRKLRKTDPRLLLLPLMTITGTLAGCALVSFFMPGRSALDCLAIGSGFVEICGNHVNACVEL